LGELVHVNKQLQERLIAQTKQSEMLWKQLHEREGAYESLLLQIQNQEIERSEPQGMRSSSKEADNCAVFLDTSSTAQGGGGSFKNRKPIGEIGCCESGMGERIH